VKGGMNSGRERRHEHRSWKAAWTPVVKNGGRRFTTDVAIAYVL